MSGKGLETSAQQWTLYLKCKTQRHYYGFDFLRHSFARSVILPGPHKGCLRMNAAKITDGKNEISSQFSCRNCYQRDDKVKLYNHKEKNPIDEDESQTEQADWCGLEALSLRKCVALGRDSMNRSSWNIADYSLDAASRHLFANRILHSLCVPAVNVGEFPTSSDSNCSGKDVCEP